MADRATFLCVVSLVFATLGARVRPWRIAAAIGIAAVLMLGGGGEGVWAQETFTLQPGYAQSEGDFGHSVDRVGDVTGDGRPEVVVGAQDEAVDFDGDGRVYVYSGNSGVEVDTFSSPNATINGHFGGSVSYAGDLGGGAAPDVLVGASNEDTDGINRAGAAYAFTSSGTLLRTFKSPNIEDDGSFGGSVNSIADLTGDGVREVLIGAPRETASGLARAGRLYVMNGATGAPIHTLDSENPEADGYFGVSASAVDDVSGDGVPDVLVGANGETVSGKSGAGRAYLFSGDTGAHLQTFESPDFQRSGSFGGSDSVTGLGDVNGDGTPDLAVAAGGEDGGESASGNVYLFNADGSLIYTLPSPNPTFLANFGTAIDGMPDTDNDGHADLIVGAKSEGTSGDNAGLAHLISGVDGTVISTLRSPNPEDGGKFGWDVAYAGDIDGDNIPDVVTGALEENVGGTGDAGRAYIHTGFSFFKEVVSRQNVSSDGLVDFGATGVDVNFSGVTSRGDVLVYLLSDKPRAVSGIGESTVSDYRFALGSLADFGSGTKVRFAVSALGGLDTPDPAAVTVYSRPDVGTGSFSPMAHTVGENGTPGDPSDDEIVVTTDSFSEFVFASDSQPLPVELMSFDARATGDAVTLTWQTATETNNAGFQVQRMGPDDGWQAMGRVDGAGTTSQAQSYRFQDTSLPYAADRLTYRLVQMDTDGARHYSDAVTVERTAERVTLEAVYPNPARQQATVHYAVPERTDATLRMYDVLGREVETVAIEQAKGRHTIQLDLRGLTNGTYFLQLSAGEYIRTRTLTVVQ